MVRKANRPVVQTVYGPVRGIELDGVNSFKGIRYGADTGGTNRFLPPKPPQSWSDIVECTDVPALACQRSFFHRKYNDALRGAYDDRLEDTSRYVQGSEDCLFLNVWSAKLGNACKAPVIVWLHPGGQLAWSGVSPWTDGANLTRNENVVVVSFNHRLGPFGFLYLGDLGDERYSGCANAGLDDMIAALRWVKGNIAAFGGDPHNVTLMGQSGGAAKVCALLASTAAAGLFHKAIVMGAAPPRVRSREEATKQAVGILDRLQIGRGSFDRLQHVPAEDVLRAVGGGQNINCLTFVAAGPSLTRHPFDPDWPAESAAVPVLVGTTTNEMTYNTLLDTFPDIVDERGAVAELALWRRWGFDEEVAARAITLAKSLAPQGSWHDAYILASTEANRDDHCFLAEQKVASGAAPVFMYLFAWSSPVYEEYGSMHVFDVPFAFGNLDAARHLFGSEPDRRSQTLAMNMSKAWAAFARAGNPSHAGLPNWAPYNTSERPTMLLDHECALINDPMPVQRQAFYELRQSRLAIRRNRF